MGGPERVKYEVLGSPPRFMGDISYKAVVVCGGGSSHCVSVYRVRVLHMVSRGVDYRLARYYGARPL